MSKAAWPPLRLQVAAWTVGLLLGLPGWTAVAELSPAGNPILSLQVGRQVIKAEVVSTPEKLFLGLGGRTELPWGTGMLFLMPQTGVQQFCMRGMLVPIDIIWIRQQQIIGFTHHLQPGDPGTFTSPGPADQVLEVPAGFVQATGLQPGERVLVRPEK